MSDQVNKAKPAESFEYELLEVDPDNLRTVVAEPESEPVPVSPWIDPDSVKLKYRIGRGPFGDVRLATRHESSADFERYHELALKVLHPLEKEDTQKFLEKFEQVLSRCRGFRNVCWLHGVSIIDGKIYIAMKVYEGSVGDKVARLKGGKLPLSEALKYGIEIAKGILELHSIEILALNLKPSNILLNDNKEAILGDFGIPFLLLGMSLSSPEMVLRLGTPNYMAPEQWEPEVRGPIAPETDSWGFACCFVEMLTGVRPWDGKSAEEIYAAVVIKQEKPQIPSGLPPLIERVINGCFEYDLRYRPLAADILNAFESSRTALHGEDEWFGSRTTSTLTEKPNTKWYNSKDQIQVGDKVRSRNTTDIPEGTVVGLESHSSENESFATVKIPGSRSPVRVLTASIKKIVSGFSAGDWVTLKENPTNQHSSVGIIHSLSRDGSVEVGLVGLETLWKGHVSDLQSAKSHHRRRRVGDFVRVKQTVLDPRFEWPSKSGSWAVGRVSQILPNGCLVVGFPGRFGPGAFSADPCQVEAVTFDTCPGVVEKYRHVEDFHWAVRPVAIALGLLAGVKVGIFAGSRIKKCGARHREERGKEEGPSGKWIPNLFKHGGGGGGGVSAR